MKIETIISLSPSDDTRLENSFTVLFNLIRDGVEEEDPKKGTVFMRPIRRIRGNQFSIEDVRWVVQAARAQANSLREISSKPENCPFPPMPNRDGSASSHVHDTWRDGLVAQAGHIERLVEGIIEDFAAYNLDATLPSHLGATGVGHLDRVLVEPV